MEKKSLFKFLAGAVLIVASAVGGHYGSKNLKEGLDTWKKKP